MSYLAEQRARAICMAQYTIILLLPLYFFWEVWKWRNKIIFNNHQISELRVLENIKLARPTLLVHICIPGRRFLLANPPLQWFSRLPILMEHRKDIFADVVSGLPSSWIRDSGYIGVLAMARTLKLK